MIQVTNIKFLPKNWRDNNIYIYIGRGTIFGNPYPLEDESQRDLILDQYQEYAIQRIKDSTIFRAALQRLHGKILVCHCKPKKCHGDILVTLLGSDDGESAP